MLAAVALGLAALAPRPATGQTADEIIARHAAARGGLAHLRAIRTVRLIGHISFGPGAEGSDTVEIGQRPVRIRTAITIGDRRVIQGYDGHTAWTMNGFRGDSVPHVMAPEEARNVIAGADLEGPLIDHARKGNRVTLIGRDTADGRPAYKLAVVTATGAEDAYYIDAKTFLQTKWEGKRVANGKPVVYESWFRDWRPVRGVLFAYRIDSDARGQPGEQHIVTDTVEVDARVPDARFAMPTAAP